MTIEFKISMELYTAVDSDFWDSIYSYCTEVEKNACLPIGIYLTEKYDSLKLYCLDIQDDEQVNGIIAFVNDEAILHFVETNYLMILLERFFNFEKEKSGER